MDYASGSAPTLNTWTLLGVVQDGSKNWAVSKNAVLIDTETSTDDSLDIRYIGRGYSATYMVGYLAIFKIFNYALSAEQIAANFQNERHWFGV